MQETNAQYPTLISVFQELRGDRVLLRCYTPDDAQDLMEAVAESRDHLRPWMPFADEHQTVEESRDWITRSIANWLLRKGLNCAIWETNTGRFLGGVGLHPHNWDFRYFEIGYWLRVSAQGHGYMTESVKLLTDYAFNELKANRVEIRCDARNDRSASVARRLGYLQEGRLRNHELAPDGSIRDTLYFSLIPSDLK